MAHSQDTLPRGADDHSLPASPHSGSSAVQGSAGEAKHLRARFQALQQQRAELDQETSSIVAQLVEAATTEHDAREAMAGVLDQEAARADAAERMAAELRASLKQQEEVAAEAVRLQVALDRSHAAARQEQADLQQRLAALEEELEHVRAVTSRELHQLQDERDMWKDRFYHQQRQQQQQQQQVPHGLPGMGFQSHAHMCQPGYGGPVQQPPPFAPPFASKRPSDGVGMADGGPHQAVPGFGHLPPPPMLGPAGPLPGYPPSVWPGVPPMAAWGPPHSFVHTPLPPIPASEAASNDRARETTSALSPGQAQVVQPHLDTASAVASRTAAADDGDEDVRMPPAVEADVLRAEQVAGASQDPDVGGGDLPQLPAAAGAAAVAAASQTATEAPSTVRQELGGRGGDNHAQLHDEHSAANDSEAGPHGGRNGAMPSSLPGTGGRSRRRGKRRGNGSGKASSEASGDISPSYGRLDQDARAGKPAHHPSGGGHPALGADKRQQQQQNEKKQVPHAQAMQPARSAQQPQQQPQQQQQQQAGRKAPWAAAPFIPATTSGPAARAAKGRGPLH